ncbi:uncharacterized protein [Amphiura filiformis]|uniref:uncharacterized protein n=1 Tax=Amphiura filiformis TaxID=82378 RepID=UPI003B213290
MMGSHQQQHQQTGEGENYTNMLTEHHVQSAIEMGLQSHQQTYQEFMESFLVLTDEDVKMHNEAKMKRELEKLVVSEDWEGISDDMPQESSSVSKLSDIKVPADSEDDLDTEELGEGTYSPRCTDVDKFGGGKKFVQVDNFVEDAPSPRDCSDEDDIEYDGGGGGYVSSIAEAQDSTQQEHLQEEKAVDEEMVNQGTIDIEDTEDERMISPLPGEAEDAYINADNVANIHQTHPRHMYQTSCTRCMYTCW